jgi:hypothetical protein
MHRANGGSASGLMARFDALARFSAAPDALTRLHPTAEHRALSVRCAGGISHNPTESITAVDAEIAVHVHFDFLRHLDPEAPANWTGRITSERTA